VRRFGDRVLDWGADHRRDLPWRHTRDPWAVLVSEVMLQQTQADRVIGYYRTFLNTFPTPAACARARPAAVLGVWSGLGYNRRALNLHRAAQAIVTEHDGALPAEEQALRALPGVGPYTARAVLSFAFGADVATVDTNVVRVLARCVEGAPLTVARAQVLADRLVPSGRSWDFNQTMFDLGATVCVPRPACAECPLRRLCRWRRGAPGRSGPDGGPGNPGPDPWRASPSARPQSRFAGSDRQGRGRLLHSLRGGPVPAAEVAAACGWREDHARSDRIAAALVAEGFAQWSLDDPNLLQLR
jgi:A/G-specific adenine glycosylase